MLKKIILSLIVLSLVSGVKLAFAQEPENSVSEEVNLDEEVTAEDLGIKEPNVLPDSPFYFLKELGRGIQTFLTFNVIAKAELKEKFASEKLIEVKKMVEQNKTQERVEKAIQNYQKEMEEAKRVTEKIKGKAEENTEVGKFLDKFIQQQTLQQKVLQKLGTKVATSTVEKITEVREAHLEKFGEVMQKLENKEKIQERLEKNLEEMKGSQFKDFKNLEILKGLEEKVPEEAKEAIQKAQVNTLNKLKEGLEKMSTEDQNKFKEYLENVSGDKEKQLEIMENIKTQLKEAPQTPMMIQLRERIEEGTTKILDKIGEKSETLNCPQWTSPTASFCEEGRVVVQKDENSCPLPPKCVVPTKVACETEVLCPIGYGPYGTGLKTSDGCPIVKCVKEGENTPSNEVLPVKQACITLWDPVCGKDGKTYSNSCFTKANGVEIEYKGICKEKTSLPGTIKVAPQPQTESPSNISPK